MTLGGMLATGTKYRARDVSVKLCFRTTVVESRENNIRCSTHRDGNDYLESQLAGLARFVNTYLIYARPLRAFASTHEDVLSKLDRDVTGPEK